MSDEAQNKVNVYSYSKVWHFENKLYAIQNLVLPVPINPIEILYFVVTFLILLILGIIFPFISNIPPALRYAVIPFGITKFLLKIKFDGKAPLKFFVDWIKYIGTKNEYIERFKASKAVKEEIIQIMWDCSMGYTEGK